MGFGSKKPDTSAMDASIRRQEEALQRQEEAMAQRDAELKAQEEAARRAREGRLRGRMLLLAGPEFGTEDQPLPGGIKSTLGG